MTDYFLQLKHKDIYNEIRF